MIPKVEQMKPEEIQEVVKLRPVLRELEYSSQPLQQSEIRRRLNRSKSTTHRRVKRLEEMEFVFKNGNRDGYVLTDLGEAVAEMTAEYVSEVRAAEEYEEFLGTVNETELRLEDIDDGEVTRATDDNPVAPLFRLAEVTAGASEVRALTNSVAPEGFEVGMEEMRKGKQEVEMVIDRRTMEPIRGNDRFGEEVRQDLRSGSLRLWVHDEPIPYQIGVIDDRLCLGAEDENRMPVALLETENDTAVEWAERTFERYRERSRRVEPDDV